MKTIDIKELYVRLRPTKDGSAYKEYTARAYFNLEHLNKYPAISDNLDFFLFHGSDLQLEVLTHIAIKNGYVPQGGPVVTKTRGENRTEEDFVSTYTEAEEYCQAFIKKSLLA